MGVRHGDDRVLAAGLRQARRGGALRSVGMKPTKSKQSNQEIPKTRTSAAAPHATQRTTDQEEEAMELQEESQHATGVQREHLTKAAGEKVKQADEADRGQ